MTVVLPASKRVNTHHPMLSPAKPVLCNLRSWHAHAERQQHSRCSHFILGAGISFAAEVPPGIRRAPSGPSPGHAGLRGLQRPVSLTSGNLRERSGLRAETDQGRELSGFQEQFAVRRRHRQMTNCVLNGERLGVMNSLLPCYSDIQHDLLSVCESFSISRLRLLCLRLRLRPGYWNSLHRARGGAASNLDSPRV